ncbi:hypothetical protein SODALDRAFT_334674 [Sodiomyces alkalinus F11]|uniref:Wbp11/ELF5/Saf1 N-terminal domain-containing protein n=1 Tax=Sodiomyces alkalinus (strain CBS 110278 / VKM F-3762 / F11) TaxID=1314773 RepID=A0A3N2PT18_SODAK|nr:hypothetical protein SODALDRAFT_334674 [Sodiomyces alkalinus F11]ROT37564.1 hypothetical protein SODALDRAFT_334674 [Sodiomyces alkalinus F11]
MTKERNYNPVQAQRKADKAKAIKKGKAEVQNRRNDKLARRNPDRIQKQIDDLKAVTTNGGKLSRHEEQVLEGLEKELQAVKKAREALGDRAPSFGSGLGHGGRGGGTGVLGKRRRDAENASSDDEDIPEDVRSIPMPRDTPPPIPKQVMDAWYAKRRARRQAELQHQTETEGRRDRSEDRNNKPAPTPVLEAKTVYEAKPMVRNLHKEAVSAFVPSVVRSKLDKGKGRSGLMEPEEADALEKEGYLKGRDRPQQDTGASGSHRVTVEEVEDEAG